MSKKDTTCFLFLFLFFFNLFRADVDHNERLSKDELVNYLFKNVQQHLKEAKDKNSQLFILIDTNADGKDFI
jgi:hypothetical protein